MTRRLLRERGYSLQANAKTTEGGQHPDRDAQFAYLNDQATDHLATGDPVISVDTKKKELVGADKNIHTDFAGARPSPRDCDRSSRCADFFPVECVGGRVPHLGRAPC